MKKVILVLIPLIMLVAGSGCSGKQIIYTPKDKQLLVSVDTSCFGDKLMVTEHSITLWSDIINLRRNDDLTLNFIFVQSTPRVKGLRSMELSLYAKNEKGDFDKLNTTVDESTVDYFNGKTITRQKNDLFNIHDPINWKEVNYTYSVLEHDTLVQEFNNLTFNYKSRVKLDTYPEELKLVIKMKYDGYEKDLETMFVKNDYEAPGLNLKY